MMYSKPARFMSLFALVLVSCTLISCGDLGSFTITEESQEVTVDGSGLSQLPIDNPFGEALRLNINLDQELAARDATGASGVFLESLDLRITESAMPSGDTDDFNFLDRLEIFANADGLDERRVAIIEDVPQDQQRISLDTESDFNLKPYVEAGMRLEAKAEGSVPDDDTSLQAIATIRIEVL